MLISFLHKRSENTISPTTYKLIKLLEFSDKNYIKESLRGNRKFCATLERKHLSGISLFQFGKEVQETTTNENGLTSTTVKLI